MNEAEQKFEALILKLASRISSDRVELEFPLKKTHYRHEGYLAGSCFFTVLLIILAFYPPAFEGFAAWCRDVLSVVVFKSAAALLIAIGMGVSTCHFLVEPFTVRIRIYPSAKHYFCGNDRYDTFSKLVVGCGLEVSDIVPTFQRALEEKARKDLELTKNSDNLELLSDRLEVLDEKFEYHSNTTKLR